METHYVCLWNNPHSMTFTQKEEVERITLGTPEERFIEGVDVEVYFRGTYAECEAYRLNSNELLRSEFDIREIPSS
ncbi:MAG: hypothetical protein C0625_02210 [Arcobacter sp.]|nr:MAG: hypothetical protein C0625_02210 [Arcobacter sp.]